MCSGRQCTMEEKIMFDYSCCDLCPYDIDGGTVCESCEALKAQRRLSQMMADLETEIDPEEV